MYGEVFLFHTLLKCMKVAIHQPNFCPYPGFFHKMMSSDIFVLMDDVQLEFDITNRNKIITKDGDWTRITIPIKKNQKLHNLIVKKIMTLKPISISQDMLATKALSIMQTNKITALCVNSNKFKYKTTGVLNIHNILEANIQ